MEEYSNHRTATSVLVNAIKMEIDGPEPVSPDERISTRGSQPKKASNPPSPVRLRNNRRRSSTAFDENVDPEQELLRRLGISQSMDPYNDRANAVLMDASLADRMNKLKVHNGNLQATTEASIASNVREAQGMLQLVHDSLLSETLFKEVRLLDQDAETLIAELEHELEEVQANQAKMDVEKLQVKSVSKEKFIERWSH